jgi:hypothetical protein
VRFHYACVALARLSGWEYLEKGPLAAALAALMRRRRAPVDLALRAGLMQRVVTSALDESLRFLLVNMIETYFPLPEEARGRYGKLISREEYRDVQETELTWAEKIELKGLTKGRVQGKRETLKRQLAAKFGPLPTAVEARIEAVDSAEELDGYLDRLLTAGSLEELGLEG